MDKMVKTDFGKIEINADKMSIHGGDVNTDQIDIEISSEIKTVIFFVDSISLGKKFFDKIPKVETIILRNCMIDKMPEDTFTSLQNLETIMIQKTNINEIPEKIFFNNPKLESINLGNNQLNSVPDKLLSKNPHLKYFYLFNNKLRSLSKDFFSNQTELEDVSMSMNFGMDLSDMVGTAKLSLSKSTIEMLQTLDDLDYSNIRKFMNREVDFDNISENTKVAIRTLAKDAGSTEGLLTILDDFETQEIDAFMEKYDVADDDLSLFRESNKMAGVGDMMVSTPQYFNTFTGKKQIQELITLIKQTGH
ncbi:MAG: leucine-rich repeat domain-containing protein [Candidatus Heimdallarchaeota archaeon]|nr:leucine-rich repeat domain-containing protein [Candidatus Heimdallarchaeota archaeon]